MVAAALFLCASLAGPHPVPPPTPRPYESIGSVDVNTLENTLFWWANHTYILENIGCGYIDHAGAWFPEFAGHSYARVRDFTTGAVVANISSSIGFGFINAFPDYDHNRLWLFGTPADRCHGNCGACSGAACPNRTPCTSIQSWWTSLRVPTHFDTAVAVPAGTAGLQHTYNQGVSRVRVPGPGMPHHRYVMISEGDSFFINDDPTGNLTAAGKGWFKPEQTRHPGPSGGVTMQWAVDGADPTSKHGWYYAITGGKSVGFSRSRDLKLWDDGYHIVMSNQANLTSRGEYQIAPYNGFPESAARKGFAAMAAVASWTKWGYDNNDGDVCCADQDAAEKNGHGRSPSGWLIWGASTQGSPCDITWKGIHTCSTNAVGRFDASELSLAEMMASFFEERHAIA